MENPWTEFKGDYQRIEDLGRAAIFLIPAHKLELPYKKRGHRVKDDLHEFLFANFGAFTTATVPQFGLWRNKDGTTIGDTCCQYEVSFVGKERIGLLMEKLGAIALHIKEECIYFKAGEDACLIYPRNI